MSADCPICRESLSEKDSVPAHEGHKHIFHKECFMLYLDSTSEPRCPVCAQPLKKDDFQKTNYELLLEAAQNNSPSDASKILNRFQKGWGNSFSLEDVVSKASKSDALDFAKIFVNHRKSRYEISPDDILYGAASHTGLTLTKYLVEDLGFSRYGNGFSVIIDLCRYGWEESARYLIQDGKGVPAHILQQCLARALERSHVMVSKYLITLPGVDLCADNCSVLQRASLTANDLQALRTIRWIIENGGGPFVNSSGVLPRMAGEGHLETLKYLLSLPNVNIGTNDSKAFRTACGKGRLETVKFLLSCEGVDPAACSNDAFITACAGGYIDVVKCLLEDKRIDPHAGNCRAIRQACNAGHFEVVQLLAALPDHGPACRKQH